MKDKTAYLYMDGDKMKRGIERLEFVECKIHQETLTEKFRKYHK